jgi:hypothetical protein
MNIKEIAASCEAAAAAKVQAVKATYPDCESVMNVEGWYYEGGAWFEITGCTPSAANACAHQVTAQVKSPAAGGSVVSPGTTLAPGASVRGSNVATVTIEQQTVSTNISVRCRAGYFSRGSESFEIWTYGSISIPAGYTSGSAFPATNTSLPS